MTTTPDLRRLAEAEHITEGPWFSQPSETEPPEGIVYGPDGDSFIHIEWNAGNDYDPVATVAYIAALSPDRVLALLDRLAALEEALAEMVRVHERTDYVNNQDIGYPAKAAALGRARRALAGTPKP